MVTPAADSCGDPYIDSVFSDEQALSLHQKPNHIYCLAHDYHGYHHSCVLRSDGGV